jgi:hypothetical protein
MRGEEEKEEEEEDRKEEVKGKKVNKVTRKEDTI